MDDADPFTKYPRRLVRRLLAAYHGFNDHDGSLMAAAMAYYFALSQLPLLVVIIVVGRLHVAKAMRSGDPPATAAEVCGLPVAQFQSESGHTEWVDGRVHQTGFTATFPPNTTVGCPQANDLDWTATREGTNDTDRTYSVVTARSFHSGDVVNIAMVDGSVHVINSEIDMGVWRAMATRAGGEATDATLP